jgi:protoporphyrinogen oxidase
MLDVPDVSERSTKAEGGFHPDYDALVLGAGISGLVAASVLLRQGCGNVLVVDEYEHLGGNHIDVTCGEFTFDIGSFIFQDDSPLLHHFPELLPHYVAIDPTFGRLNPQRVVTRYPISIEDDLLAGGPLELGRILASVAAGRLFHRKRTDARTFARYWIGDRLLRRSGLEHYMQRFYGVPADQIDIRFAESRMLWIREHAMVSTHLRRLLQKSTGKTVGPTNTQLARPREGFAPLYAAARLRLEQMGARFMLGTSLESLEKDGAGFTLTAGGGAVTADRVVSTIPIPQVEALCGLKTSPDLRTTTLLSLFFSFEGERGFPHSVLFNFSHGGAWKRLTMYSDIYGRVQGREYFAAEVNADGPEVDVAAAAEAFRRHATDNGVFTGDLRLEGSHALSTGYPIYTAGAGERAEEARKRLRVFGVESLGRQGGFDYQPTSRHSTLVAEGALSYARSAG